MITSVVCCQFHRTNGEPKGNSGRVVPRERRGYGPKFPADRGQIGLLVGKDGDSSDGTPFKKAEFGVPKGNQIGVELAGFGPQVAYERKCDVRRIEALWGTYARNMGAGVGPMSASMRRLLGEGGVFHEKSSQ